MIRFDRSDRGIALPTVLGLGTVMMLLVGTALTVVLSGQAQAVTDQDSIGAVDAAYAGVGDYLARLNLNPLYYQDGNPADTKYGASGTRTMDVAKKAFGSTAAGTWATIPGSDPNHPAKYRYEVDNSEYKATGTIHLRSTGLVGTSVRSIVANIRVSGFFDYVYFTDFETQDPAITGTTLNCSVYAWGGRNTGCGTIRFTAKDTIQGPLRSNDTIVSCSATFNGLVQSASTTNPLVQTGSGCASSGTFLAGQQRTAILALPDTNAAMQTQAETQGCLYTGPTTVTYNADGTMTVVSPWTRFTRVAGTIGSNPGSCGAIADLHSTAGARVNQLDRSLLYVQNVPTISSDPNTPSTIPPGFTCLGADGQTAITGTSGSAGWTFGSGAGQLRHPLAGEVPASGWTNSTNVSQWSTTTPAYGCTNGDIYVSGTDTSQTTMGSQNYVYVTGDLTVSSPSKDVLGVIGQNGVLVYNPMKDTGTKDIYGDEVYAALLTDDHREIDAAIMSVAHTFQVQNFDKGDPRGTLVVFGSISQKFRGPVGTSDGSAIATGYAKSYQYDTLLKTTAPPDFLSPSSTSFAVSRYASVPAAFNASGVLQ